MTDIDRRLQFLENQLQRNERWTSLADAKAVVVLVAVPTLSGLAAPRVVKYSVERYQALIGLEAAWWQTLGGILYGLIILAVAIFAILAMGHAVQTVMPRTKVKGQEIGGNIFFSHISEQDSKSFRDNVLQMAPSDQVEEYIRQVYATSKVCDEKYRNVGWAIQASIGFATCVVAAYTIALIAAGV